MGKTHEERLAVIRREAADRSRAGHDIYLVTLLLIQIGVWGDFIEAIEAEGWKLDTLAMSAESFAVVVFRRGWAE